VDADSSVSSLEFYDQDLDSGQVGGTIRWTPPTDIWRVLNYNIYYATSTTGSGRSQHGFLPPGSLFGPGQTAVGTNSIFVTPNHPDGNFTRIVVYTQSRLAEESTPVQIKLIDYFSPVSFMTFLDGDLDSLEVGGVIYWEPPVVPPTLERYQIYFATDTLGLTRSSVGAAVVGGNSISLPANTPYHSHTHLLVYSQSAIHEMTTPSFAFLSDVAESVSQIVFVDYDLDANEMFGTISWLPPGSPGTPEGVVAYSLYFALSPIGEGRVEFGEDVAVGNNQALLPADYSSVSNTADSQTVTCTFTADSMVDAVFYNGTDITNAVSGERKYWSSVNRVSFVKVAGAYLVVVAHSTTDLADACIGSGFQITCTDGVTSGDAWEAFGSADTVDATHMAGGGTGWVQPCASASGFFLSESPKLTKIWATKDKHAAFRFKSSEVTGVMTNVSFSHMVIYTRSTFVEQTTPVSFVLTDRSASVSDVFFSDSDDIDQGQVGGTLLWSLPARTDAVTQYVIYLFDAVGGSRTQLGAASHSQISDFKVPSNTGINTMYGGTSENYTHFLVYTRSSLLEQSTPQSIPIYDDFLYVCDELPGITCGEPGGNSAAAGAGKCSPSAGCNDCGLTAARQSAVKKAITRSPITLVGAAVDKGTHMAQETFAQCGISADTTFYQARGMANPAITGSPKFMCKYGCLANLTSCRLCSPHSEPSEGNATEPEPEPAADSDGLSIWRYLACRYRNVENAAGDDLKYAYVFGSGQFIATGADMEGKVNCEAMAMAGAAEVIAPFDIGNMECGPDACLLSLVDT